MRVTSFAKPVVVRFEYWVSENGDACPMMESVVKGQRASSPHEDFGIFLPTLTAFLSDGSDSAKASEGVEISETDRVVGVAEQGSKYKGSNTGKRGEDDGVGVGLLG